MRTYIYMSAGFVFVVLLGGNFRETHCVVKFGVALVKGLVHTFVNGNIDVSTKKYNEG